MAFKDEWIRSSFGDGKGAEVCIRENGYVALRHTEGGPVLLYSPAEWLAFTQGINAGEFEDLGKPGVG